MWILLDTSTYDTVGIEPQISLILRLSTYPFSHVQWRLIWRTQFKTYSLFQKPGSIYNSVFLCEIHTWLCFLLNVIKFMPYIYIHKLKSITCLQPCRYADLVCNIREGYWEMVINYVKYIALKTTYYNTVNKNTLYYSMIISLWLNSFRHYWQLIVIWL